MLLLGYGNVARAFLKLLSRRSEWLLSEFGVRPTISGIGSRSRGLTLYPEGLTLAQAVQFVETDADIRSAGKQVQQLSDFISGGKAAGAVLLIELTMLQPSDGEPALTHIRSALEAGLNVVTANKGPLAFAQASLLKIARQHGVQLRFESTVMDGLPLINLAQFTLPMVGMQSFRALLNTTSCLVLELIEQGSTLGGAIRKAQELGITEADPWYDLDGFDAAMKTTILTNTLFDSKLSPSQIKREGIRSLSLADIRAAAKAGTPYRLISAGSIEDGKVTASVQPTKIAADDIMQVATGTTSLIVLETEAMGTMTLIEHDPELIQTAYGVLSDLITILRQNPAMATPTRE